MITMYIMIYGNVNSPILFAVEIITTTIPKKVFCSFYYLKNTLYC